MTTINNCTGEPKLFIPKLCNQILFSKTSDDKVVLTFVYQEGNEDEFDELVQSFDKSYTKSNKVVIERILMCDKNLVEQTIESLKNLLKDK